jgi:hypothetical protein
MKYVMTLLLLSCFWGAEASPSVYKSLAGVNRYWLEQRDIQQDALPAYKTLSAKEWIRLHLSLVEQTLRNRHVTELSAQQQQRRMAALDHLHQYWQAGNFPLNEQYSYRTPIFIDRHDNFCAVGYLVKATGYEAVSRMIASRTNLAYVMDMQYPELDTWAKSYGFTKEELAWIQPTYPPPHFTEPLGGGTDGSVKELYVSQDGGKLYVGGIFGQVDNTIAAANIAYVTESTAGQPVWHAMGTGIGGQVNAICEYQGKVFAGGHFSSAGGAGADNIAYWENGAWHNAGCLYGTVKDLVVFNGELYACGAFDVCAALSDVNFARWNGSSWSQIPGLSGQVNTMEVVGNKLFLGGQMYYQGNKANVISWSPDGWGIFVPFGNNIESPINDFETFQGLTYAVCSRPDITVNSPVLFRLVDNQWQSLYAPPAIDPFLPFQDKVSLNTLLVEGTTLMAGGNFVGMEMMSAITNSMDVTPPPYTPLQRNFFTDNAIHKMVLFKNNLVAGGDFLNGMTPGGMAIPVGGIAKRSSATTNIPAPATASFRIYPNPASAKGILVVEGNGGTTRLTITDISGRAVFETRLNAGKRIQQVQLPVLVPALYMVRVYDVRGEKYIQKLLLQ